MRRSSRKRSAPTAKVAPSVALGLTDFCNDNSETIASMLSLTLSPTTSLVNELLQIMGINSLNVEQLLARFFSQKLLSMYCTKKLNLSGKGSESILAARISKAWLKGEIKDTNISRVTKKQKSSTTSSTTSSTSSTTSSTAITTTTPVLAIWNDEILASTTTYEWVEGNVYFPINTIHKNVHVIQKNLTFGTTFCHWKGHATYSDVHVQNETLVGAMWEYETPYPQASRIKQHVAFWNGVNIVNGPASSNGNLGYIEPSPSLRDGKVGWEALCWFMRHPPRNTSSFSLTDITEHTDILNLKDLNVAWKENDVQRYATRYRWSLDTKKHLLLTQKEGLPVSGKQNVGGRVYNLDGPGDDQKKEDCGCH